MNDIKIGKGTVDFNDQFEIQPMTNAEIINNRKMINGTDDGLMQVHPLKHPLSMDIFKAQIANNWVPQEVEMTKDVEMWNSPDALSEQERTAFKRSLAFASNLDGILTDSLLTDISKHITSPEAKLVCTRQSFEEAIHVLSYATLIEALGMDSEEIYGMYRKDMKLYKKNTSVLQCLAQIADPTFKTGTLKSDQTFLEACTSYIILEGIYFYSVFLLFYILKRDNKMPGSAVMIQFINRDEDLHVQHFSYIINTIVQEQPELWTPEFQQKIIDNFVSAVELEASWGVHCLGEGILGLSPEYLKEYIQYIGNQRLKAINLPEQWPGAKNPYSWTDELTQGQATETNFFEGRVKEYKTGTLQW